MSAEEESMNRRSAASFDVAGSQMETLSSDEPERYRLDKDVEWDISASRSPHMHQENTPSSKEGTYTLVNVTKM